MEECHNDALWIEGLYGVLPKYPGLWDLGKGVQDVLWAKFRATKGRIGLSRFHVRAEQTRLVRHDTLQM